MPTIAYEIPGFKHTAPAAADLSAGQYFGCKVDGAGRAARCDADDQMIGVQQNKPDAIDRATELMQTGVSKASAGAAVTQGAAVKTDANGQFIDAVSTDDAVGFAMTGASGINVIFSLLLVPHIVP